jgi:hypothetical protein
MAFIGSGVVGRLKQSRGGSARTPLDIHEQLLCSNVD